METLFKDPLQAEVSEILVAALTLQLLVTSFDEEGGLLKTAPDDSSLSSLSLAYANTYAAYKMHCCCKHSAEEETKLAELKMVFQKLEDKFGSPQIALFKKVIRK